VEPRPREAALDERRRGFARPWTGCCVAARGAAEARTSCCVAVHGAAARGRGRAPPWWRMGCADVRRHPSRPCLLLPLRRHATTIQPTCPRRIGRSSGGPQSWTRRRSRYGQRRPNCHCKINGEEKGGAARDASLLPVNLLYQLHAVLFSRTCLTCISLRGASKVQRVSKTAKHSGGI